MATALFSSGSPETRSTHNHCGPFPLRRVPFDPATALKSFWDVLTVPPEDLGDPDETKVLDVLVGGVDKFVKEIRNKEDWKAALLLFPSFQQEEDEPAAVSPESLGLSCTVFLRFATYTTVKRILHDAKVSEDARALLRVLACLRHFLACEGESSKLSIDLSPYCVDGIWNGEIDAAVVVDLSHDEENMPLLDALLYRCRVEHWRKGALANFVPQLVRKEQFGLLTGLLKNDEPRCMVGTVRRSLIDQRLLDKLCAPDLASQASLVVRAADQVCESRVMIREREQVATAAQLQCIAAFCYTDTSQYFNVVDLIAKVFRVAGDSLDSTQAEVSRQAFQVFANMCLWSTRARTDAVYKYKIFETVRRVTRLSKPVVYTVLHCINGDADIRRQAIRANLFNIVFSAPPRI